MAKYKKMVITNQGQAAIAQATGGVASLSLTAVKAGAGTYMDSEVLETVTDLKDPKQTFPINSVTPFLADAVKIRCLMSNADLTVGYTMQEVGLFGRLGEQSEILIALSLAEQADYMPDRSAPALITTEMYLAVNNDTNVTLAMTNPGGTYALASDMEDVHQEIAQVKGAMQTLTQSDEARGRIRIIRLPVAGWGGAEPYMQVIDVPGAKASEAALLIATKPGVNAPAAIKAYKKAYASIADGEHETLNNRVRFIVRRKPEIDIQLGIILGYKEG